MECGVVHIVVRWLGWTLVGWLPGCQAACLPHYANTRPTSG